MTAFPDEQPAEDEDAPPIFQLGYASAATHDFDDDELEELLAKARAKNKSLDVTGMLLYHEGSFLQVLEGEQSTVETLYNRIAKDTRHANTLLLFRTETDERAFGDWTMGYRRLQPGAPAPEGLNRFLQTGATGLVAEDGESIRRVLLGFRDGNWHRTVSS